MNILEFILLADLLINYDFNQHVASDIGIDQKFLPSSKYELQDKFDDISEWTKQNLMLLNETKSNYIIYTRSKQEFSTRLAMNGITLEKVSAVKLLGVWLDEDMSWETNTKQICINP